MPRFGVQVITMSLLCFLTMILFAAPTIKATELSIVPRPLKAEALPNHFTLSAETAIACDAATLPTGTYLAEEFQPVGKLMVCSSSIPVPAQKAIVFRLDPALQDRLGREGYLLQVSEELITLAAGDNAGLFYAVQTLRQLLPPDFEKSPRDPKTNWEIPCVTIEDKPRFGWRAYMLDEARHFKGMDTVKSLLDEMARLKMNIFHWHLTDEQGWRIEIKKYPLLTEIGGKRRDTQIGRTENFVGQPHEGWYSQEQIREIIRYANERHITIVPEIDMPGHITSAIAAYPWLGTTGKPLEVPVYMSFWKTHPEIADMLNVSDPRVLEFCRDVITEVMSLFPGQVIHIGGDEVFYDVWDKSANIKTYMQREGLQSLSDVQMRFTNEMSEFIRSKGRRMMGWNDILGKKLHDYQQAADAAEGREKLAPGCIVHFWKGDIALMTGAAEQGFDIVNSYYPYTYLDYSYEKTPLEKAYSFDPVPAELDAKYHGRILGLGCQMWSEWAPTVARLHEQTFPRIAAHSETGWSAAERKDYTDFLRRLTVLKQRWDIKGIGYAHVP